MRRWYLYLVLVILFAALIRLPATQRGFFFWDEGQFLFGAQPGVLWLRDALGIREWPRPFAEQPPFDSVPVPYSSFSAKPAYDFLMIGWGTFMGLTPNSVAVLSSLFGLGAIGLLFGLARKVFDARIALGAAALLAVSGYHVHYSGSQGSFVTCGFFLLLATTLYVDWLGTRRRARLALAGAALAFAWGCHYNSLLPSLAALGGLEACWWWQDRREGRWAAARPPLIFGGSFLAMVAGFELFYRTLIPAAYSHLAQVREGYFEQLRFVLGVFGVTRPSGIERFPAFLLDSEGIAVCALAAFGWAVSAALARWQREKTVLLGMSAAQFLAPTLGGLALTPVFSRVTVVALPFVALFAAVGIHSLADLGRRFTSVPIGVLRAGILIAVLCVGLPRAYDFAHLKSGHAEAARYVREHGDGKQMTLGYPVDQFYLGSFDGTYSVPLSFPEIRRLYEETGTRLLVLDLRVHVLEEWGHPLGPQLRDLERRMTPVATIPNPIGATLVVAGENAQARESLRRSLQDPHSGEIRIYDLATVFSRRGTGSN